MASSDTLGFSGYSQDLEAIKRRRKLAEMLIAQSMQPMEQQQAPGIVVPVSPFQGIAKLVQAYAGGRGAEKADEESKGVSERYQKDLVQALKSGGEAMGGGDANKASEAYLQHPETRGVGISLQQQANSDAMRKKKIAEILRMGQGAPQGPGGQAGPLSNLPPQIMALMASGDPELVKMGQAAMDASKGVAQRPGAPVVNPYSGQIIAQAPPSMPPGVQATMGPQGAQASPVPGFRETMTQMGSIPKPDAPMIPVKTSSGQDIQLTQPEYLQWQQTQQLPARLGGRPQAPPRVPAQTPPIPRVPGAAPVATPPVRSPGLGTIGAGQTEADRITQERQRAAGKAVDEAFAKDYVAFTQGGAQDATKQLSQLQDVIKTLGTKGTNVTGPVVGRTPDVILSATNPKAIATRERVEEVVQRSLRTILGAQFTEKEGERLIARAYNPTQLESENKIRVQRLFTQLEQALKSKMDAAAYFEKNGTLQGWKGKMPSMADFDVEEKKQGLTPAEETELKRLRERYGR